MDLDEWRKKLKPEKLSRKYLHLDEGLDLKDERSYSKFCSTISNLKQHQFLPFIKKIEREFRYRKDANGIRRKIIKDRPIMYASHMDAHIYSFYNSFLFDKYEAFLRNNNINESVIAYRKVEIGDTGKGKCNVHFAKEVFEYIQGKGECVVVTQDVEKFFDNLDHRNLKERICKILQTTKLDDSLYKVFNSLTRHRSISFLDFKNKNFRKKILKYRQRVYRVVKGYISENNTGKGIPQGSPLSGLLANIYMTSFDIKIADKFPSVFYRRYSDDIIFVCDHDTLERLLGFVGDEIKNSKLSIQNNKTFISYFRYNEKGSLICKGVTDGDGKIKNRNYIDYLGLEFDGQIRFRRGTFQKLSSKKINKTKVLYKNQKYRTKKNPSRRNTRKSDYFKLTGRIIGTHTINKQILNFARRKNKR